MCDGARKRIWIAHLFRLLWWDMTKVFFTGRKKISVPGDKYEISEISEISGQI
jgi:hypothetical protein